MIHDTQSAQISQKQHERNLYAIMKKITIRAAKHLYICDSFKQGYGKYSIFLNYDLVMKKSKEGQFKIKLWWQRC